MPDNDVPIARLEEKIDALTNKVDSMHEDMRELFGQTRSNEKNITANAVALAGHLRAHEPWTKAIVGAIVAFLVGAASAVYAAIVRGGHG